MKRKSPRTVNEIFQDSFDYPDFNEAVTAAYHWQGETDASQVKLRG